ncbi:hypothetical protein ACOZ4I_10150 [Haloarcula salina]|uniref:hypothetical protein n=1 Tax=Haloarcula salina TaxID=1429914 RepID=UPI003C6FE942
MQETELASQVASLCTRDPTEFDDRVREEASWLVSAVEDGAFDSELATTGLEYECYVVDRENALTTLPRCTDEILGCEKEIGRHQIEFRSSPQPFSATGLQTIESEMRARFEAASDALLDPEERLVSDGFWTISPQTETGVEYLTDHTTTDDTVLATNMCDTARYHAQGQSAATRIDAPNATYEGKTALLNSLTTSIQPHFVVEQASELPTYFRYALRAAGPILALGVNSPLFPPAFYDDVDGETIVDAARLENRIGVFESVMNDDDGPAKVAFPEDVESVADAVESIASDPTIVPRLFDDQSALRHFSHKHGCYWRWIRPVFDAGAMGEPNVRIEFRPLPGQPTLQDTIAFVGLFAGLLTDFTRRDHPVSSLDWADARHNFYAAAADGLSADLRWIDRSGDRITDTDALYADLFACARAGLETAGFDAEYADDLLSPLESRARTRRTPGKWKLDQVRDRLDEGEPFDRAVRGTQRRYIRRQAATFETDRFAAW